MRSTEVRERRADGRANLAAVRAFYLDIAQWAMEEPARWGAVGGAVPDPRRGPGPAEGTCRPQVPDGPAHPGTAPGPAGPGGHVQAQARLSAARLPPPGRPSRPAVHRHGEVCAGSRTARADRRIWAEDPVTGKRRDLTGEEDRAFWTWAAVETLRHTGIRIEELTELVPPQPDPVHPARHRRTRSRCCRSHRPRPTPNGSS